MSELPHIVRQRLAASSGADHPDADLLSAFAERQLAGPERERVLAHLGACAACREIVALATPETVAAQPVLTPAQTRSWWSIRSYQYGLVAAALAIAAVGLVLLHPAAQRTSPPQTLAKVDQTTAIPKTRTASSEAASVDKHASSTPNGAKEQTNEARAVADLKSEGRKKVGGVSSEHAFAADSVTIAKPTAQPPKELDQLASAGTFKADANKAAAPKADADSARFSVDQYAYSAPAAAPPAAKTSAPAPETQANVRTNELPTTAAGAGTTLQSGSAANTPAEASQRAALPDNRAARKDVNKEPAAMPAEAADVSSAANSLASERTAETGTRLTPALQRAQAPNRVGALAKTEEEKQKALARDPNYAARGVWRINNGRLQKLDPSRNAFDDVPVSGTARLSVVASLGNEVWVGGTDGALHYSNDLGAHWIPVSTGGWSKDATFTGITPTALRSVEVHLSNGERWRSADAGASWSRYQ
jgi:Putative zinc-finger